MGSWWWGISTSTISIPSAAWHIERMRLEISKRKNIGLAEDVGGMSHSLAFTEEMR